MGKRANKRQANNGSNWTHEKHEERVHRKVAKLDNENDPNKEEEQDENPTRKKLKGYERSIHLSHDSYEKKQVSKLRLHISKMKREIEALRKRLSTWDELEEQAAFRKKIEVEKEAKKRLENEASNPDAKKRRNKRLGPETWKLRGAARPAYEVYDFDTRYVCPHLKAHEEAKTKAKRVVNAFNIYKGRFGIEVREDEDTQNDTKVSQLLAETCRTFLSISMQSATLNLEAKRFKSARENLLEIIELEGTSNLEPITNARCRLIRMYIDANRPESARRLWEKLPSNYSSVWIRFSAALLEFVSWKVLGEDGSTEETASKLLTAAIRSNVFCAYFIAYYDTFEKVMEYVEDIEDAENETIEQAIEYFSSEQLGSWIGTEGAIEWIRDTIIKGLTTNEKSDGLSSTDLEWKKRIESIEMEHNDSSTAEEGLEDEPDTVEPDTMMFTGMFRVGMDILFDSGKL